MKYRTVVRLVAVLGILGIVLAALLPAFGAFR